MTEKVSLKAEKRAGRGKTTARQLRRRGYIPGVVYGRGEESASLKVRQDDLDYLLSHIGVDNTLIELEVSGEKAHRVLIREVQRHPFKPDILHVDFLRVRAGEKIRLTVPVHLTGKAPGVEQGGIVQQQRHDVEIECLPNEIPELFEADVSELDIGDSLRIGDLATGDVTLLEDPDAPLCVILPPTVITVEEEEEEEEGEVEGVEPEVVGRGEKTEADEESAEGKARE